MVMRILISNDDGISSPGLRSLAKAMGEAAEVYVAAPDSQKSAASHSISFRRTLYVNRADDLQNVAEAWAVAGTPVDSLKWGIHYFQSKGIEFDLVLSGINHGYNLATDVLYSGTVAVAGEASLQGLKSIALSLGGKENFQFDEIAPACGKMIPQLAQISLPKDTFLSVNFPTGGKVSGKWKVTRLGSRGYRDHFTKIQDEKGQTAYRYEGEPLVEPGDENTDTLCVKQGDISVTPLRYRFTNDDFLGSLKSKFTQISEWVT